MPTTLSYGTCIGFGAESTRGTAVARSNWTEVMSCEMAEAASYERFNVLQAASGSGARSLSDIVSKRLSGRIVIPLQYSGIGWWLEQITGSVTTTGSNPYTHTYDVGVIPPRFLTVEKIIGSSGRRELYNGVCATAFRLVISRSSLARLELDVLGYKSDGFDSAGSPSFGAAINTRAVKGRHFDNAASGIPMQFTWNGANYECQELVIAGSLGLSDVNDIGSFYATNVDQGAERLYTVSASVRHVGSASDALRTAHLAQTSSDLTFSCTGDGSNQQIAFTCRNAELSSLPATPLSGEGRVMLRPEWALHNDASDGALTMAVTNTDTPHSTN